MPATLVPLTTALSLDPGLTANLSAAERQAGLLAAEQLNALLLQVIAAAALNADGRITAEDMQVIATRVQADPSLYAAFLAAHGDDEGNIETGFHLLQNDGGTLMFRGRKFADTVADAIYHFGFDIIDGRFVNEDGDANELARDVAGWLNFFLNGVSAVYGTEAGETLHSGTYSDALAAARNEAFYGGGGNDAIWADLGNDSVYGGTGNDQSGGGVGADMLWGEAGNDSLWGEAGNDTLYGGDGNDVMGGGGDNDLIGGEAGDDRVSGEAGNDIVTGGLGNDMLGGGDGNDYLRGDAGNDTLYGDAGDDSIQGSDGNDVIGGGSGADRIDGGTGNDRLYGDVGADRLYGGAGNDQVSGGQGNDLLGGDAGNDTVSGDEGDDWLVGDAGDDLVYGGAGHDRLLGGDGADQIHGSDGNDALRGEAGNDTISGGNGADAIFGGAGRDLITLWEDVAMTDTLYFFAGDSGRTLATIDRVEGFQSGSDRIDLRGLGVQSFEDIDFSGTGPSCYYDGRFLRIDTNGDRATDMMVEFAWVSELAASDFVLA